MTLKSFSWQFNNDLKIKYLFISRFSLLACRIYLNYSSLVSKIFILFAVLGPLLSTFFVFCRVLNLHSSRPYQPSLPH